VAALAPASAVAGDGKPTDLINVSEYRDDMVVVHDGRGHYVVAVPVAQRYTTVFYGDGKTFYEQRVFGGGLDTGNQSMSASFWDPRVNHRAHLEQSKGAWKVRCGKREGALTPLAADQARKLVAEARFRKHPWKYEAYLLLRDDRGVYYYVDRLREEHGGKGHRLWVGPKGSIKQTKLVNIVSDSEGDIFATRTGELRLITSKKSATWISRKSRTELTAVPVLDNLPLIYSELGVYVGDLSTPCDHI
jgi:hypothetical protein